MNVIFLIIWYWLFLNLSTFSGCAELLSAENIYSSKQHCAKNHNWTWSLNWNLSASWTPFIYCLTFHHCWCQIHKRHQGKTNVQQIVSPVAHFYLQQKLYPGSDNLNGVLVNSYNPDKISCSECHVFYIHPIYLHFK